MASTRDLRVRLTPRQHEKLKEIANSNGKTVSQYMRNLILENDDSTMLNKFVEIKSMIRDIHKKVCLEGK